MALSLALLPAGADEWNKKTIVTFTRPVELPGVVLPPGTYVFKLLDSLSNRHIVQVFNEDESKIFTTILAIPNYRLNASGETIMTFDERPRGRAEALRAWFYPGDNFGQEFVYPKERALQLVESTQQPVLSRGTKPLETTEEVKNAAVVEIAQDKKETEILLQDPTKPLILVPVPTKPLISEADRLAISEPPAKAPIETLPATASPLPLIGLAGILSLGVARLLKQRR
jgi:hypothetical protein